MHVTIWEKTMYWSPKHWFYFKTTVWILCRYFFVTLVQIQCPSLYTLFLNGIPSPSICLFPYFWLFTSNSQKLEIFSISLEGSSYWELTVVQMHTGVCEKWINSSNNAKYCRKVKSSREMANFSNYLRDFILELGDMVQNLESSRSFGRVDSTEAVIMDWVYIMQS